MAVKFSKIIFFPVVVLLLIGVLFTITPLKNYLIQPKDNQSVSATIDSNPNKSTILSTSPNPLQDATVFQTQEIKITFSDPVENIGELKTKMDPNIGYTTKLSDDRKTATFTPKGTYEFGQGYTLFILKDTKFDGGKRLEDDAIYHFKTIKYRGV